jgi:hypothetical protein
VDDGDIAARCGRRLGSQLFAGMVNPSAQTRLPPSSVFPAREADATARRFDQQIEPIFEPDAGGVGANRQRQ